MGMPGKKERLSGVERRDQIVQAVISVMAEQGLSGTTTKRIAERAGVSEPALYRYFPGKRELVLEALDRVSNTPLQLLSALPEAEDDVLERIMKMSDAFYEFVMDHPEESMLLFEAVTGSRDEAIRTALSDKFMDYTLVMSAMFEEGKKDRLVRQDLDTAVAAWQILALGITLVFASLVGLGGVLTRDKALLAVREVLENIVSGTRVSKKAGGGLD
jgi:TetR/AcrR family transcriptional regulator